MTTTNTMNLIPSNMVDTEYTELVNRYGADAVNRQLDLEMEGQTLGKIRYMNKVEQERVKGNGANVGAAKGFLTTAIPMVIDGLNNWFDKVNDGTPGKRHKAAALVKDMSVETIAYMSLKVILSESLMNPLSTTLVSCAKSLGNALEAEVRFSRLMNTFTKKERRAVEESLSKRVALHFQTAFLRRIEDREAENGNIGRWTPWSNIEKVNIGTKLIELVSESTGMVHIKTERSGGLELVHRVVLADKVANMIDSRDVEVADAMSINLPMVIEPKPWTDITGGGYYMQVKRPLKFVRSRTKDIRQVYAQVDMPNVYKAVNAIQSTAWTINTPVLDIMQDIMSWTNIPDVLDLPSRFPSEKPIRPADATEDEHKAWKKAAHTWYQLDNKRRSRRLRFDTILATAEKYRNDKAIYFPHNVDFRGRVYPVTNLHPQGDDFMKATLRFSEGRALGEHGAYWLAYHGANLYGLDKKPAAERVDWVNNNTDLIQAIANNPLDDLRWTTADEPFQFLAFCLEWNQYILSGKSNSFLSHLPVAFDGSCSGLQHFSAMLRDEIGGNAVNLVPHDTVQDVYSMVADKVLAQVKEDAINGTGPSDTEKKDKKTGEIIVVHDAGTKAYATEWLAYGVTRSVVKRPVMTLAYGSKEYGFSDQILEDTVQPANELNPGTFTFPHKASRYLAKLVWNSVQGVVVKACEAMKWLQTAAGALASATDDKGENLPVTWFTPAGFPIRQKYTITEIKRIDTVLNGSCRLIDNKPGTGQSRLTINVNMESEKLDYHKQRSGIAPNFVHSMDASHLMLTVNHCHDAGINAFAMIHDSYGCHAGNAQTMFEGVREVFVDMYSNNNVLEDFRAQCNSQLDENHQLPPIPTMGSLKLENVKQSLYAFA